MLYSDVVKLHEAMIFILLIVISVLKRVGVEQSETVHSQKQLAARLAICLYVHLLHVLCAMYASIMIDVMLVTHG